ncbi:MAG TPA: ABC transporter permease, partial [Nitrospira sp.]|nr:ABC transporter permease [Nitrospira sp.]
MLVMALRIALRALARNKLRSFLTMLGIIIGVGAVIAMVAIGEGAKQRVQDQIARLGTNVLVVLPGTVTLGGARTGSGGVQTLVASDAKAIINEIPLVSAASPVLRSVQQVIGGDQNWSTSIQGVAPEFLQIRNWSVSEGRFISDADVDSTAKVALVGQTVAKNLFGDESPIDSIIRVKKIPFRIIGVLGPKGQTGFGTDQDDTVMIPY